MPGIFGQTISVISKNADLSEHLCIHTEVKYHKRLNFNNRYFISSLVHFDFQNQYSFHSDSDSLEIWLYGDPLIDNLTGAEAIMRVMELIKKSYPNISKLNKVDGLFNIVIYDKKLKKLFLVNDRNGLAHLYYAVFNNQLVWASELRAFVTPNLNVSVKKESIMDFLNLGYLVNNSTWFNEVDLLSPASYLEWNLESKEIVKIVPYWSHKILQKDSEDRSEKFVLEELAFLFRRAVDKRVGENERVGITLSGGMDSRAIFANIPYRENGFTAITRGMNNSGDIKLAKDTTSLREDCQHIIKEINAGNWLEGRIKGAIATSGEINVFDMNAMSSLPIHKDYFDINLDGSEGVLLKGLYTSFKDKESISGLNKRLSRNSFNSFEKSFEKLIDYNKSVDSDQHYFIYQNIRRFSVFGSIQGHDYGIISRFPILDHDLQEFIYQLPAHIKIGEIWRKVLLREYPQYFKNIENLDTGRRLYESQNINFIAKAINRFQEKFGNIKYSRKYHNYPKWLSDGDRDLVDKYILTNSLYIYEYIPYPKVKNIVEEFYVTGAKAMLLSRILSISIFLENYRIKQDLNNQK